MTSDSDQESVASQPGEAGVGSPMTRQLRSLLTKRINLTFSSLDDVASMADKLSTFSNSVTVTAQERDAEIRALRSQALSVGQLLEARVTKIKEKVTEWSELITSLSLPQSKINETAFRAAYFEKRLEEFLARQKTDEEISEEDDAFTRFLLVCEAAKDTIDEILSLDHSSEAGSQPQSRAASTNGDSLPHASRAEMTAEISGPDNGTLPITPAQPVMVPTATAVLSETTDTTATASLSVVIAPSHPVAPTVLPSHSPLKPSVNYRPLISPTSAARERAFHRESVSARSAQCNGVKDTRSAAEERKDVVKDSDEREFSAPPPLVPSSTHSQHLNGRGHHPTEMSAELMGCETKREEERKKEMEKTERDRRFEEKRREEARAQMGYGIPTDEGSGYVRYRQDSAFQKPLYHPPYPLGQTPPALPSTPAPVTVVHSLSGISLPAMPLPKFSGKEPWAFPEFLLTLESMVMSQPGLTDLSKMFYLKSCLTDDALDAVGSIVAREGCYKAAINRLRSIYGKNRGLMAAQLRQSISKMRKPTENCGLKDELKVTRDLLNLSSQLLSLPDVVDNPVLTDLIITKLGEKGTKKAIKYRVKDPDVETLDLLQEVEESLMNDMLIEKIVKVNNKGTSHPKRENVKNLIDFDENSDEEPGENEVSQILAMFPNRSTVPNTADKPSQAKCVYCDKHPAGQEEKCKMFSTPDERSSRCRQLRLCFRCLVGSSSHNFKRCEMLCAHCNGRHHKSLCKKLFSKKITQPHTEGVKVCRDESSETELEGYYNEMEQERDSMGEHVLTMSEIVGTTTTQSIPRIPRISSCKLMTFLGQIILPSEGKNKTFCVNILIDPGASVSLISERLVKILRLQCIGIAETGFSGVGGKECEYREYKVHKVSLKSPITAAKPLTVMAYEFPDPLTGPERQYDFESRDEKYAKKIKVDDLILKDPDGPLDILISLKEFAKQLTKHSQSPITLPSGMMLYPTAFGYIRIGAPDENEMDGVHIVYNPDHVRVFQPVELTDPKPLEEMFTDRIDTVVQQEVSQRVDKKIIAPDPKLHYLDQEGERCNVAEGTIESIRDRFSLIDEPKDAKKNPCDCRLRHCIPSRQFQSEQEYCD